MMNTNLRWFHALYVLDIIKKQQQQKKKKQNKKNKQTNKQTVSSIEKMASCILTDTTLWILKMWSQLTK